MLVTFHTKTGNAPVAMSVCKSDSARRPKHPRKVRHNGVKGQVLPRTAHEGPEGEQKYIPTLSLTSALGGAAVR